MDDTLCRYTEKYQADLKANPQRKFPQSRVGFFTELEPLDGAIESVEKLKTLNHEIYFLTAPSYKNPHCYMEKRLWIEKYFGLEACKNLIIARNKGLVTGDYLIDDMTEGRMQENFSGELIHLGSERFPSWADVVEYFSQQTL
jgi:5'(3')-deoxyribonucleotidase